MNVLLAIKPEFARKILSGEKTYEFRRTAFTDPDAVEYLYLYASAPEQRVVGAVTTTRVIEARPAELWELFEDGAGIDTERFDAYFAGCDTGYAIQIDEVYEFDDPIDPTERLDEFTAPMSFRYLDPAETTALNEELPVSHDREDSKLTRFSPD